MKHTYTMMALGAALALVQGASQAGVTPEEAKQLGKTLTLFGAEAGANGDGSIPAYTGGNTKLPPGHKAGSGRYINPFASEKPLLSIDSKNMAQYATQLTDGTRELMRRHPGFRADVYPTHRTVAYTKEMIERCPKNAVDAKLTASGNGISGEPYACVPFPIPKSGLEVMWNHQLRNNGYGSDAHLQSWVMDASGHRADSGGMKAIGFNAYLDPTRTSLKDNYTFIGMGDFTGPPSQAGEKQVLSFSIDYDKTDMKVWVYTPGQRRVRLAPEFNYDTPVAAVGGIQFYDEIYMFNGKPDRFSWKLLGKKEMYVPYNGYAIGFDTSPDKTVTPNFVNPDYTRWEKHRVWVVEATLKPGQRHVHQRRMYYVDEDSWTIVGYDGFDQANKLQRVGFSFLTPFYDAPGFAMPYVMYDLNKGAYLVPISYSSPQDYYRQKTIDPGMFRPERLIGASVR
jgi:hypothetical protein